MRGELTIVDFDEGVASWRRCLTSIDARPPHSRAPDEA
jgi:hypothetical protein